VREPRSRSLVRQTVWIVLSAQLLCAVSLSGVALLHERHTRIRAFDVRLQGRSDSLLGAIQDAEDPDDNVMIDPAELNLPGDDVYAVYNQGGRLLGSSRVAPPVLTVRQADGFRDARIGKARYRVLQREGMRVIDRPENDGVGLKRPVTIVYASPEDHLWHEIFEAVRFYLVAIVLAAGVTVALVGLLIRRALSPLSELAMAAEQLSLPALNFAAPPSVLRVRELRPLAEVLGDAIERLRVSFAKEHQFVGDAAHELKTAIAVVRSSVQLLMLKRRSPDEYAAGLDRVLEDNSRVEALAAQMLQLASLEEGSAVDAPVVDLGKLAAATLERLRPFAEVRGVLLRFASAGGGMVRIRPEHATVLVSNLVMNAVQHSASGQTVNVTLGGHGSQEITLDVEDTGAGIAREALPHIFERFYREDRSRSRETGGAGLGLAICKSIVEATGGSISVESAEAQGTRVTVIFRTA
jgi:signal transduction histidine kinase